MLALAWNWLYKNGCGIAVRFVADMALETWKSFAMAASKELLISDRAAASRGWPWQGWSATTRASEDNRRRKQKFQHAGYDFMTAND
jgi:hypothetical protein